MISRHGSVGVFSLSCESREGHTVNFEMLLLPLVHLRDTVDRFLGSIAPVGRPLWLGHEPLVKTTITGHELIWPDGRPHAMIDSAHRQAPFLPHMHEARIVRSDRRQFRVYDGGLSNSEDER